MLTKDAIRNKEMNVEVQERLNYDNDIFSNLLLVRGCMHSDGNTDTGTTRKNAILDSFEDGVEQGIKQGVEQGQREGEDRC